ncbi:MULTISPECIES: DUF817 domain-containing protein [Commensalibacter]|uniref:DUF817 domain-containing protein n=2 Tax=Commensalibacter TaxID=1079922 RepID=W7DV92_9PROT|nr:MULTISPECIES: DUF817 domain-containing protein [Commensalibacter]EUK18950.1 hypothetical protein COMX_04350 [Commensalibacter papalotli (ex Servin-Garciduenas et al. 2014)]CAI3926845.1 DUF817 family (YoaT) [Commensalibacter papalotli (ex Botero et al. 2024)]
MHSLQSLDEKLLHPPLIPHLYGWKRFCVEFLFFGAKEARSCLFVGLFFLSIFIVPKSGIWIIPRYDVLFIIAITIQLWMVYSKLETLDELKAVMLFHIVGFVLEVFKTSANIQSWSYPDFAYTKVLNVPLFSGFMYAAIGSYIIQAWRLFDLKIYHHPPYIFAVITSLLIYINFFTHHYFGDYRWYIAAGVLGLYARTTVVFTPYDRERKMPLLLAFILIGFFIWLAENISTFFGIWKYPNQITSWSMVHTGKWSSWALLVIMTFTITVFLKHIKKTVYIPR